MADPWARFEPVSQPQQGADPWARFEPVDAAPAPSNAASTVKPPKNFGIDWNQPVDAVRQRVAALPAEDREDALRQWADATVAREDKDGGIGRAIDDTVRTVSRGSFVGPYLDELTALSQSGLHAISGGALGSPYDEAVAYQRARDRAVDQKAPVLSTVGQLVGGVAGGGAGFRAATQGGSRLAGAIVGGPFAGWTPGPGMASKVVQGGTMAPIWGANYRFGSAEGDASTRAEQALDPLAVGRDVALGMAAPPVIAGVGKGLTEAGRALSPTFARIGGNIQDRVNRFAIRASAGDAPTNLGAEAAAEQTIANQLARANISVNDLRQRLAATDEATRFHSSGRAQNVTAPVDLDSSLQRLASTVYRQQPEAANMAQGFIAARQSGLPPRGGLPPSAGLPVRDAMSQTQQKGRPIGQFERIRDGLRRALLLEDNAHHGHQRTAYRTRQDLVEQAREEARAMYGAAYQAGQNVNVRPTIEPVLARWATRAADEPQPVAQRIARAMRLFQSEGGPVSNIERFDKAKQFLDGQIEDLMKGAVGRNRYLAGVLTELKNDLLGAVDGIQANGLGNAYRAAREQFSSRAALREALKTGQDVFREGSEVAVDQYRQLATEGERKLFRLGLMDSFEQHMGRQKRTADVSQVFESPRIQGILSEIIPRSRGVFADRPERFGRFLANEKQMISTRDEVLGNSKTAQRLADDNAAKGLATLVDTMRANPSMTGLAMQGMERILDSLFGFRADVAASIARRLFTADPVAREQLLQALERRMGATRMEQFAHLMAVYHRQLGQAGAIPAAQLTPSQGGGNGG